MAQAEATNKLLLAEEFSAMLEDKLADVRVDLEKEKKKHEAYRKEMTQAGSVNCNTDLASMKYTLWKPKMECGSCSESPNDVDVFLPCGHAICQKCVDEIINTRKRACPFDRTRFTTGDVRKIYWAAKK